MRRITKHLSLLLLATALAACGGGGGGYGSNPPPASSITVAGTGVKGAALAGATVNVKCASGNATATTASSGAYSVTITGGSLPCVIKLTGAGGEVFHSVVPGTGASGTFTANVTPLTEMVVAHLAGTAPDAYFTAFGSSASVSSAALAQSIAYVKSAIASVTDLGSMNPVTDALAVGDALDQEIDAVVAALSAAGVTLQSVTAAIVANPSAPAVVAGPIAAAASDCPWMKSGRYLMLELYETEAATAVINAGTLSGIGPDGLPFVMTPDGDCQYTIDEPAWSTRLIASSSGVLLAFGQSKTVATDRTVVIALPEQVLPLSELAGTWSAASWEPVSGSTTQFVARMAEITFDATGQVTALLNCVGLAPCVPRSPPLSRFVVNSTIGGFDEILPGGARFSRMFGFKTLAGRAVLVVMTPELQYIVATRKQPIPLPAVGALTRYRQAQANGDRTIDDLVNDSITVNSTDTTAKTATRSRGSDGRVDTLFYDKPRDGLRHRVANSCTTNLGAPANCAEVVNLQMQGMGFRIATSTGSNPANTFFNIQFNKP